MTEPEIRAGAAHGETDGIGMDLTRGPVHIHDLQATILHCLGIDHERLTYRFPAGDYRVTDLYGNVVQDILA